MKAHISAPDHTFTPWWRGRWEKGPSQHLLPAFPTPKMSFQFPLGTNGEDVADAGEMSLWDSSVAA